MLWWDNSTFVKLDFRAFSDDLSDFCMLGGIIYRFRIENVLKGLKIGF